MSRPIRACTPDDLPAIIALEQAIYPGKRSADERARYLRGIFFDNPFASMGPPSLVALDARGRGIGFLGVLPRPFQKNGRRLSAAGTTSYMVHPAARGRGIMTSLLAECFHGPQDFTFCDAANDGARRCFEKAGGVLAAPYSTSWLRPLRPLQLSLSKLVGGHPDRARTIGRLTSSADRFLQRTLLPFKANGTPRKTVSAKPIDLREAVVQFYASESAATIRPRYDSAQIDWLTALVIHERRNRREPIAAQIVDSENEARGLCIYYRNSGGVGEVICLQAGPGAANGVVQALLADAWRAGSTALAGRIDTPFLSALSKDRCFLIKGPWVVCHSLDATIIEAFHAGRVLLSRLDGEWPL